MIEATVTGIVCGDVAQTSRDLDDGLRQWTFTLATSPVDGRPPERIEVSWVESGGDGESSPFVAGAGFVVHGALRVCQCGTAPRMHLRATRWTSLPAAGRPALHLAGNGGSDAA